MKGCVKTFVLAAIAAVGLFGGSAQAGLIFNIQQTGAGVIATGTGNIQFTGSVSTQNSAAGELIIPSTGNLEVGPSINPFGFLNIITAGPTSFGPGLFPVGAVSSSGDTLGFAAQVNTVILPSGYVSGTALSGQTTWSGATLASLGITPGTYNWTTSSGGIDDTLTLNVQAVPEPSTLGLSGIGLLMAGFARYRRRRAAA